MYKIFLSILFILAHISLCLSLVFWISIYVNSTGGKLFSIFVGALFLWNRLYSYVIIIMHSTMWLRNPVELYLSSHYLHLCSHTYRFDQWRFSLSCHFIQLLIHLFDKYLKYGCHYISNTTPNYGRKNNTGKIIDRNMSKWKAEKMSSTLTILSFKCH